MPPSKREELLAALAEEEKREKEEKDRFEVEIGSDGNYARVPYEKGKAWLQKTFGIDLDEEEKQEPEADKGEGDGKVRRFGRQVS